MQSRISVAIDGPSGAGKSTLARMTSGRLGLIYVDTGAIYRCVGLYAFRNGIDSKDVPAVISSLANINIEMRHDETGLQRMVLNGEDVTDDIRLPQISMYASDVSAIPEVRAFLMDMQRSMADKYSVVMDGRDIGTVVLPNADVKIFLTASSEERARRRHLELTEKGIDISYEQVLAELIERDRNDSSRAIAPLKQADDAILLDTTNMDLEQSFEFIKRIIEERLNNG